ncbi:phosphotransferase [Actinoplanes sp. RD1]|uniref:phosphotransferase n=1 Tax=Actinoplanes sp. RD1 TaxID=3064538 RepID=UPI00274172F4|nr:phosphotransferase [Actinoplanes sp. RD1]
MRAVLEMLWEARDPGEVLTERFGFGDAEAAGRWVAAVLDEHWGVRAGRCERIVMSDGNALAWVRTPDGPMLLKWSVVAGLFPRLAEVARLTTWLGERGLPVSAPVPASDGRLQVEAGGVSVGLQRVIAGELLDTADSGQVRAAGAALARLQDALAVWPGADRFPAPLPLVNQIPGWLDSRAGQLPVAARDRLRALVAAAPAGPLPRQLVHFDIRSANILWAGDEVAAFLDFEDARHEHRVTELARAAILLGTRYHDWGPVPPEVHATFLAGYESVRPLTPPEAEWLPILLRWQALAMVPTGADPTGWGPAALRLLDRS